MAIQSLEDAKSYLQAKGIDYTDITELTGGTANFVFRLTNPSGETVVMKHAEPFIRQNAAMAFPAERMDFEAAALRTANSRLSGDQASSTVRAAELHSYDEEARVLIMSDGGRRDLKAAYAEDASIDAPAAGEQLGRWLATLHSATATADIGDNKIAKSIYRFSYQHLAAALEEYGFDPALGKRVNEEFGSLLATDDECVCHGDFWPGNVLVSDPDHKLTIVDWEITRRGTGATDVGQFAAESWLLDRFRGGKGMLPAFLRGYADAAGGVDKLSKAWKQRVVVHCGTHLAFWPTRVEWGTKEETKQVVAIGRELLVKALEEDWDWLGKSDLGPII